VAFNFNCNDVAVKFSDLCSPDLTLQEMQRKKYFGSFAMFDRFGAMYQSAMCNSWSNSRKYKILERRLREFMWLKFVGVALESGPCFLLTSYTTVVTLFSDAYAPDVIPLTWVSLFFSVGSISLMLLSMLEYNLQSKITVILKIEGFSLNVCDI